jgi:two-component system NtrC family response regulator
MFGHAAGAFTGATKDKKGLFEEANKGTIFLDEVGEMPLDLQAKLLRVIENGEYIKVGESKVTKVDVRIIAATNRNFIKEIEVGNFRQDLYYRLSIFKIHLPSLRQRIPDIEPIAKFFLKSFNSKTNKKITALSPEFLQILKLHNWPGNIRELKNIIERSVILENNNSLTPSSLPYEMQQLSPEDNVGTEPKVLSAFSLASAEKIHIQKVMNHTNGNKTETARLLNIALTTLYRKLDEYKIQ